MKKKCIKEQSSLKVIFLAVSVRKNQSKFQNNAFSSYWSPFKLKGFLRTNTAKKITLKLNSSLETKTFHDKKKEISFSLLRYELRSCFKWRAIFISSRKRCQHSEKGVRNDA